jgi:nucleotide-binding universal stress UspA family protein
VIDAERLGPAMRPVLLCYDGSEESRHAIAVAASLLAEGTAVVLTVGPLELVAETYAAAGSGAADTSAAVAAAATARARAGAEEARRAGFRAEARGELDAPVWRAIVKAADELDAAVIVLGSERIKGLRELVEGSVSHQVAAHARRPVLVVPRAKR